MLLVAEAGQSPGKTDRDTVSIIGVDLVCPVREASGVNTAVQVSGRLAVMNSGMHESYDSVCELVKRRGMVNLLRS